MSIRSARICSRHPISPKLALFRFSSHCKAAVLFAAEQLVHVQIDELVVPGVGNRRRVAMFLQPPTIFDRGDDFGVAFALTRNAGIFIDSYKSAVENGEIAYSAFDDEPLAAEFGCEVLTRQAVERYLGQAEYRSNRYWKLRQYRAYLRRNQIRGHAFPDVL
jgi:hypothetical protein